MIASTTTESESTPQSQSRPGVDAAQLGTEAHRQHVIEQLAEHWAVGTLGEVEFERRVDRAERATTADQLNELLWDLDPRYRPPVTPPRPTPAAAPPRTPCTSMVRSPDVPDRRSVVSVFSKVHRSSGWRVPRKLRVVAVMGKSELDFRHAVLSPGVTEIQVVAMMGSTRIIVPPGVNVELVGGGIMGRFHDYRDPDQRAPGEAPVLRISGVALMGAVKVQVWLEGESPRQAALRMRNERLARRRGHVLSLPASG